MLTKATRARVAAITAVAVLLAGLAGSSAIRATTVSAAYATADTTAVGAPLTGLTPNADAQQDAATRAYWTASTMLSAIPAEVVQVNGPIPAAQPQRPDGPAGAYPAAAPSFSGVFGQADAPGVDTSAGAPNLGVAVASAASAYSYPFPFTRFSVFTPYTSWPYDTEGKIFFTDSRTRLNYVCSGSAINSTAKDMVFTAGHCVVDGGSGSRAGGANWYTNWIFCPAYRDGSCPLGTWTARQLWSNTAWINSGGDHGPFNYDYGAALMRPLSGVLLVNKLGGEGIAWNYSAVEDFVDLGYPQAAPFNGNRLIECNAGYAVTDGSTSPAPIGIGCDMTGGSSGGSWYIGWGGSSYRNGHNDYKYNSQPLSMYSPYYGTAVGTFYNTIKSL